MEYFSSLKHIGFIMDGNGRWATNQGLSRVQGHKQGLKALENLITVLAKDDDVKQASFYCFSTENWDRPALEVKAIMSLLQDFLVNDIQKLYDENVKVKIKGDLSIKSPFDDDLRELLISVNEKEIENPKLIINLCINYGGQDEIVRAVNSLVAQNKEVNQRNLNSEIHGEDYDLDLIIRTSGEQRLSNFLLWQSSYAELLFVDYHWPDMCAEKFEAIKTEYASRQRRFGKI